MFGKMFGGRATTRSDVALAITGAVMAAFKAWDTTHKYKLDQAAKTAKETNS